MKNRLFRFADIFKETLWGGGRILPYKGLPAQARAIGESWELSGIEGSESVVVGGNYDGLTLPQLVAEGGSALLGADNFARFGEKFPLLVKFIDAAQPLSVQVHPDDRLARERHGCPGKSEMWYVVDTAPGAYLLDGFSRPVEAAEYAARVEAQTLPEVLRRCEVRPGEVYYLPAGRVHSIGPGCLICEIQQSSDITYRIYDFGRLDSQGRPRQLHVEEAKEAIDFAVAAPDARPAMADNQPVELVRNPHFTTSLYRLTEPMTCDYEDLDSFVVLVCTEGECRVACGDEEVRLTAGHTVLVAAEASGVALRPEGQATLLETFV